MITVKCVSKENTYRKICVSGHALYDTKGRDLVCAGVSSIVFGTLNALDRLASDKVDLHVESDIVIEVLETDLNVDLILNVMMIQLETVQNKYSNYIEIKQEVSS